MTTPKVILFNGPPGSGKDFVAKNLYSTYKRLAPQSNFFRFQRMAYAMKASLAGLLGLKMNFWDEIPGLETQEEKNKIIPALGVSGRQWLINYSEKHMKPLYGENIWGKLFVERAVQKVYPLGVPSGPILMPDSGFEIEIDHLSQMWGIQNLLLLRIHRAGYGYEGDSRSYLDNRPGLTAMDVSNKGDDSFPLTCAIKIKEWLNG